MIDPARDNFRLWVDDQTSRGGAAIPKARSSGGRHGTQAPRDRDASTGLTVTPTAARLGKARHHWGRRTIVALGLSLHVAAPNRCDEGDEKNNRFEHFARSLGEQAAVGEDGPSAQYGWRLGALLRIPRSRPSPEQRDHKAGDNRPERQAGRGAHELDDLEAKVL